VSIEYHLWHRTTYRYSRPMHDGYTVAYLLPRPTPFQVVERAEVEVDPEPDERSERIDVFGNRVLQVGVHHSHDSLTLHAESDVVVEPAPEPQAGPRWEEAAAAVRELRGGEALTVRPFVGSSPYVALEEHGPTLRTLADGSFPPGRDVVEGARALCHEIFSTFAYDPTFTDVSTPLSSVLEHRRGVCQDFAHLAAGALRSLGLAARYVSGYIETTPPPGRPRMIGADASHAWCSVWVPEQGWIDFDPTNDHLPTHRHVTVAWGRDYGDVAPARGVVIGPKARQTLTVAVDVERVASPV
jgi:transglutaminase-like putative cysteine protease